MISNILYLNTGNIDVKCTVFSRVIAERGLFIHTEALLLPKIKFNPEKIFLKK